MFRSSRNEALFVWVESVNSLDGSRRASFDSSLAAGKDEFNAHTSEQLFSQTPMAHPFAVRLSSAKLQLIAIQ